MSNNENIKRKNTSNTQPHKQHTKTDDKQLHTDKIKNQTAKSVPVRIKVKKAQKEEISPSENILSEPKVIDESKEIETENQLLHTDKLKNLSGNNSSAQQETVEPQEIETEQESTENENQNAQYQPPIVKYQPQYQPNQQYPPRYEPYQPYQQYQPYNPYQMNQGVSSQLCCERCGSHNVLIRTESEKHLGAGSMILMAVLLFINIFLLFIPILDVFALIMIILIIVAAVGSRKSKLITYAVCQNCGHSYKVE